MKKRIRFLLLAGLLGCITGYNYRSTEAAYAVIDTKNIAQQLKTYEETAKLVTTTAQQTALLAKEIAALPASTLNSYSSALTSSINTVNSAIQRFAIYNLTHGVQDSVEGYWNNHFPKFRESDSTISEDIFNQHNIFMTENRSENNKQTMTAYKELMLELKKSQDTLASLLQENSRADGGLKAQQIANQIAGIEANIKHIELSMQALKVKHQVEKDEADVTRKLNQEKLNSRNAAAVTEYISTLDTNGTWKAVRDPWQASGIKTIGW